MDTLIERCAGIDIGKDTLVACVRTVEPGGRGRTTQTRTFTTFTASLEAMAAWFRDEGVTAIVMEATGSY
jgi:transposase